MRDGDPGRDVVHNPITEPVDMYAPFAPSAGPAEVAACETVAARPPVGCQNGQVTYRPWNASERPTPAGGPESFRFDGVTVAFGETQVLRDVDLAVPGSGVTVVLGPSGSGKSTLTRLCNRLLDPTSGAVSLHGTDVRQLDVLELRRSVGMVFQRPTLFDGTVRDNLEATGVTDLAAHEDILESVGLGKGFLSRNRATLSGGEAQRVCLARTLLMRPGVLVADEPTASLDEGASRTLEGLARGLADDGVPILWVTHDLAQVERIADRRVVLEAGRVVSVA